MSTVEAIVFTRQCHYIGSSGPPTADYVWIPSRGLEFSVTTTESKTVPSIRRVTDQPYHNAEQLAEFQQRLKEMWEFNNFTNRGVAVPVMTPELQAKCDERIREDDFDPNPAPSKSPWKRSKPWKPILSPRRILNDWSKMLNRVFPPLCNAE